MSECVKCNNVITLALKIHIVILINDNTQHSANKSVLFSKIVSIFFLLWLFFCFIFSFFENVIWSQKSKRGSRRIARVFIESYDLKIIKKSKLLISPCLRCQQVVYFLEIRELTLNAKHASPNCPKKWSNERKKPRTMNFDHTIIFEIFRQCDHYHITRIVYTLLEHYTCVHMYGHISSECTGMLHDLTIDVCIRKSHRVGTSNWIGVNSW